MELTKYLVILWRRRWVIVVTSAATLMVVVIGTLTATPMYIASTRLRVLTATGGSVDWLEYNIVYSDRLMNTYSEIATSGPVLEEVAQRLSLDELPQIEVEIIANTELLQITAEDTNPILAREVANALAEILVAQSKELYTGSGKTAQEILSEQLAQIIEELGQAKQEYDNLVSQNPDDSERIAGAARSIELKQETHDMLLQQYERVRVSEAVRANTLSIVEPAVTPQSPSKPNKALNIALGAMVGFAGGLGLAFLLENLDTTLHTTGQIEATTELATLGQIPTARGQQQTVFFNGNSPQAEAFRHLRTRIFASDGDALPKALLVTSAEPGEGKSTIVANLAFVTAQAGRRIIAVDGDMRRPTLHEVFDLPNEMGLSSILNQEAALDQAMQDSAIPGVKVLTSGPLPVNPAELLGSSQMTDLIKQLAGQFDVVLLDTPSLLAVTDAAVLAPAVDAMLLVVGRAQAHRETIRAACQNLSDIKARSIGVVINRAAQNRIYSYYHRSKE